MFRQLIAGMVIVCLAIALAYYYWPEQPQLCQICRRPMHEGTSYFATLESGREVKLCCPRCGLHFQEGRTDVESAEVVDFNSRERIEVNLAVYVVGSSVHPCCSEPQVLKDNSGIEYERTWDRCMPSVLAFKTNEDAERFIRQNGGALTTWDELAMQHHEEPGNTQR